MKIPDFKYLVLTSAIGVAICAGLFSITGIASLFVGASIATACMAGALELAKLVSASFVYRYWTEMAKLLRTYLVLGIVCLSIITSAGIYGFLTRAYASGATEIQVQQNQQGLYASELQQLDQSILDIQKQQHQLQSLRGQQENRLDSLIQRGRSIASQQNSMKVQDTELQGLQTQLTQLRHQKDSLSILQLQTTNAITTNAKIGPFVYFAKTLGISLDKMVHIFILLLVCVFDPLSISLFIAYSFLTTKRDTPMSSSKSIEVIAPVLPAAAGQLVPKEDIPSQATLVHKAMPDMLYFMNPNYDWQRDDRWKTDPQAKAYYSGLGIPPTP